MKLGSELLSVRHADNMSHSVSSGFWSQSWDRHRGLSFAPWLPQSGAHSPARGTPPLGMHGLCDREEFSVQGRNPNLPGLYLHQWNSGLFPRGPPHKVSISSEILQGKACGCPWCWRLGMRRNWLQLPWGQEAWLQEWANALTASSISQSRWIPQLVQK